MSAPNDSGPAFPAWIPTGAPHACDEPEPVSWHPGISRRDYLAVRALQGLLAEPVGPGRTSAVVVITGRRSDIGHATADHYAEAAYVLADAMLKASTA